MPSILERIAFYNPKHIHQRKQSRRRWRLNEHDIVKPGREQTPERVFGYRKELLLNQTPAEKEFRNLLRIAKVNKHFRSQEALFGFIIDFYAPKLFIGIEIDGSSHNDKRQYDAERTTLLSSKGIHLIRFTNTEVFNNQPALIKHLRDIVKKYRKLAKNRTRTIGCKVYLKSDYSQEQLKKLIPS